MAVVKEYKKEDLTVVWKPEMCIHSENCFKGLPDVFDPNRRPWIQLERTSSEDIINQIKKCPSGALSYRMENEVAPQDKNTSSALVAQVTEDGPLLVSGDVVVKFADGREELKEQMTAFCRCGASGNKPFCDGSHKKVDFKG